MPDLYRQAAEALKNLTPGVAVTGAGVSAESGIPTFRGEGGIWEKYPPDEYATIDAWNADPDKVWRFWVEMFEMLRGSEPNPAHRALAELERQGRIEGVITQNIDNMHQEAGSKNVVEYHGNARRLVTDKFGHRELFDPDLHGGDRAPLSFDGTPMRPDVIMFGERIPSGPMVISAQLAETCKVMLVVGTSAQVYPGARLPLLAHQNGAFIIEANTEETDFTHSITHVFLKGPAGETLPKLVDCLKSL